MNSPLRKSHKDLDVIFVSTFVLKVFSHSTLNILIIVKRKKSYGLFWNKPNILQ